MKKREAKDAASGRIRAIFAGPAPRPGRLDFLFDERARGEGRAAPATSMPDVSPVSSPPEVPEVATAAALAPAPWDSPPPVRPRRDPEAFVTAGIDLSGDDRMALTVAVPLEPVWVFLEIASILFYGAIAALHARWK